ERVAVALERQKELGAVFVLPLTGVHCAAPQSDDDGHMLDADRTLEFACSTRGALKYRFLRKKFAEQRFFGGGAEIVQIVANAEGDFLGVENFACICCGAVLGGAGAFDARISLERDDACEVLPGVEPEIFVTGERRNMRELA